MTLGHTKDSFANRAASVNIQDKRLLLLLQRNVNPYIAKWNFLQWASPVEVYRASIETKFAGLHLQMKRVAHEQNTRLAVSSNVLKGSVAL